ncbi:hypothetical protein JTF06_02970 [Desemzia sp. RIT804]|uniref:hypothetical protein n=1 Tax=Desemzia sp. RIT 804 TaxID=2810209 RepID=UPI00194EA63A|nr:hypothetical protein [Desemzia sp. RIT 804]MBM6613856.1 hypothetical protein [Desemzia sp. RIT 804]
MKNEVRNHILGDTIYFLLMMIIMFTVVSFFNLNRNYYYAMAFIVALISGFLGKKLLEKYFPHLIRGFKNANLELFLFAVVTTFLGVFVLENMDFWVNMFIYYLVFIGIYGYFEQKSY